MFHYFTRIVWHESYLATFSHARVYFSATRPDNFLIFTDTDNRLIFRMDLTTHSFVVVPLWRSGNPIAIDYDPVDGRIYWTDVAFKEIHSASIDGQDQRVVKYLGSSKFRFGIILKLNNITQTCPCNIQQYFTAVKVVKKCYIFLIFAQNIDCGYTLEPPQ